MIAILKNDFQNSMVDEHVLDIMIASKRVIAFHRSNEWVVIGRDPVREQNSIYSGKERRKVVSGDGFYMK